MLAALASHQYGAFVLVVQLIYVAVVWYRERFALAPPLAALGAVVAVAVPLWRSNLVLASRFDLGGQGGSSLGGPYQVLEYLRSSLGDFAAGWVTAWLMKGGLTPEGPLTTVAAIAFALASVGAVAMSIATAF